MYNIKWKERKRKMKTWNKGKRTLALLVCVLLTVLSVVPAMGATGTKKGETSKFTINNTVSGHTYKLYQILVGDVSNLSEGTGTLSNVDPGSNAKKNDGETDEEFVKRVYDTVNAVDVTADTLGKVALAFVNTAINPEYSVTGDGNTKEIDVNNGYYIVVDTYMKSGTVTDGTDTISSYLVAVVGDTMVEPKDDYPTIDKKIVDTDANKAMDDSKKTDTAAIGDTINYEVSGNLPDMTGYTYYYYYITDTLSKGLTLNKNSFKVMVGDKTLAIDTDYHIYVTDNGGGTTGFKLAMENLKKYATDNSIAAGATIKITYDATVNKDAAIGLDPNTNTVQLTYSNNPTQSVRKDSKDKGIPDDTVPTGVGPDKVTKTYVTELTIIKVDGDGNALKGAQFTLTGKNLDQIIVTTNTDFTQKAGGTYYKLKTGAYTQTAPKADGSNNNLYESTSTKYECKVTTETRKLTQAGADTNITMEVDESGYLKFTGLNAGEYTLTETKTPDGYNTIDPINFTINASVKANTSTTETGGDIVWSSTKPTVIVLNGTFTTTIKNTKGTLLPSTGGIGTRIFYIVGGILMVSAGIVLVTKARFKKNK